MRESWHRIQDMPHRSHIHELVAGEMAAMLCELCHICVCHGTVCTACHANDRVCTQMTERVACHANDRATLCHFVCHGTVCTACHANDRVCTACHADDRVCTACHGVHANDICMSRSWKK